MPAVVDASPLILLAKVGRLSLLSQLYGQIVVPPAVAAELGRKQDPISPGLAEFVARATRRAPAKAQPLEALSARLGAGEAESIAIAAELPDAVLVMDDAEGRRAARELGLRVTGLLGALVEAKARGLCSAIGPVLEELVAAGFWISDAMRATVLRSVGE